MWEYRSLRAAQPVASKAVRLLKALAVPSDVALKDNLTRRPLPATRSYAHAHTGRHSNSMSFVSIQYVFNNLCIVIMTQDLRVLKNSAPLCLVELIILYTMTDFENHKKTLSD